MTLPVGALFGVPDPGTSPAAPLGGAGNMGDVLFANMLEAALGPARNAAVPVMPVVTRGGATPAHAEAGRDEDSAPALATSENPVTGDERRPRSPAATTPAPSPTFPGSGPRIIRIAEGTGGQTPVPPDGPAINLPQRSETPAEHDPLPVDRIVTGAPDGEPSLSLPTPGHEPTGDGGEMHALPVPWPVLLPVDTPIPVGVNPPPPTGDDFAFISGAVRSAIERLELATARRETGDIVPELRSRLERLIDRMWSEFGYRVEVVETTRTQARQDVLFAQGRSTPGSVVTWTRASAHTDGRAADVRIDGGWTNTAAFEQLARVAREEGLRTLWPRDPGHVELPTAAPSRDPSGKPVTSPDPRIAAPATTDAPISMAPRLASVRVGIGDPPAALPVHSLPMPREQRGQPHSLPIDRPLGWTRSERPEPLPVDPIPVDRGRRDRPLSAPPTVQPVPSRSVDPHTMVGVARVASVATVAPPAVVATVASVAQPTADARVPSIPLTSAAGAENTAMGKKSVPVPAAPGAAAPATRDAAARAVQALTGDSSADSARPGPAPRQATPRFRADGQTPDLRATTSVAPDDARVQPTRVAPQTATSPRAGSEALRPEDRQTREASREPEGTAPPAHRAVAPAESTVPAMTRDAAVTTSEGREVLHATGTDAAERVARLTDSRDAARERPLSSVVLRLEAPDGGEDRVRVDLRGTSVDAAFDVRDGGAVDRLGPHLHELAQAFARQGLEPESITVRTMRMGDGLAAPLRSAAERELAPARLDSGLGHDSGTGRERDARGGQPRPDDTRDPHGRHRERRGRQGDQSA